MTFMKTPAEITSTLTKISGELKHYFLAIHITFLGLFVLGLIWKRFKNQLLFSIMLLLALSSTVISSIYVVIPNIVFFGIITIMLIVTYAAKKIRFELENLKIIDWIFAGIGIIFGFWYLHWVEDPIALNALLYSPLGGVNCPTLLLLTTLLILSKKPKSMLLTSFVGALTIYFGFFGMIMLGAYVDIALILCGIYLVGRSWFEILR